MLVIHYLRTPSLPLVLYAVCVCFVDSGVCLYESPILKLFCPFLFADVKIAGLGLSLPSPPSYVITPLKGNLHCSRLEKCHVFCIGRCTVYTACRWLQYVYDVCFCMFVYVHISEA